MTFTVALTLVPLKHLVISRSLEFSELDYEKFRLQYLQYYSTALTGETQLKLLIIGSIVERVKPKCRQEKTDVQTINLIRLNRSSFCF